MKKVLLSLMLLLSLTILVACKDNAPTNTAPVLSGVVNLDHVKGTVFDNMAGVTATDEEDGDLTAQVVVTGNVDINVHGSYTLEYSVKDSEGLETKKSRVITVYTPNRVPVITVPASSVVLEIDEAFNPTEGVTAEDAEDGVLTSSITVTGSVDTTKLGKYQVVYKVTDKEGLDGFATVNVLVVDDKSKLYNGTLNLKFADAATKHTFFAAAEKYLLENMYGGIPFYVANSFSLLAQRVTLPVDTFIPSYGWGTRLAEVTEDDSQVLGVEGQPGKVGEYTYRDWNTQDFSTLNFWVYDDSVSATYIDFIEGGFYRATLNDANNGWEYVPALASSNPTAVNAEVINGKTTSKTWRVSLRQDLEWAFNPAIDTTGFDTKIDANDYVWTYREALNKNMFRAISGGGDFVSEVAGAEAYSKLASEVYGGGKTPTPEQVQALNDAWAKVGIKKVDDYTLEFTMKNAKGEFDIFSLVNWPAMNQDLYTKHGDKYGTSPLTVASSGEYVMTTHETGKITKFVKNEKYPHADESMWTGWDIYIYQSAEVAFQAFLDGKLETAGVPNARVEEFISDPRLLQTPDATTWRLNINGLGTVANQKAQFPGSTYVPEPILAHKDMRLALFHIMDRKALQDEWVPSSGIGITYFSSAYYVDPESGIPYRATEQGQAVSELFGEDTWGYNAGLAQSLFKSAVAEAIAAGEYQKGTANNYTVIELEVRFMQLTTSEATKKRADFVKESFEKLVDDVNFVKVVANITDTPFPGIYYDYQMTGDFDIAIGGISGSALNASSFLDVFSSDNRGGFTINWGFDTSLPEITVTWDHDGNPDTPEVAQVFSYDAIVTALNGKATIENGDDVAPELKPGTYTSWTDVKNHLEDFVDVTGLPVFEGEAFEIVADESQLGGVWVVLPETYTFEEIKALFEGVGAEYLTFEDQEGGWGSEFVAGSTYVIYGPDWTEGGSADFAEQYGVVVPSVDGQPLQAILVY